MRTTIAKSKPGLTDGVIYLRVSSTEQEREGYSIDAQRRLMTEYAARNGIRIVAEYFEAETAKKAGRKQFAAMLKFLKSSSTVKAILVEKTDRLHRNITDWAKIDALFATDVSVHFVKEGEVVGKDSGSSAKFMYGIRAVMSKQYSDNLSEEARKGMMEKAAQGIWPSAAPFGYRNVTGPNGKKIIEPDPERAPAIRLLFETYAAGDVSIDAVAEKAVDAGLAFRKSGGPITRSTVHQILRNAIHMGDFYWKGRRYSGNHEPIVSRDLWQAVQDRLDGRNAKRHRRAKHEFAYARLMTCGRCGSAIVGELKKGRYVYYHCTEHKGTCADPYTREADLDAQFAALLESLSFDYEVLGWIRAALIDSHRDTSRQHEAAVARLQAEHKKLQNRIDAVYIDKLDRNVTGEFYTTKTAEWRADQERCMRSIADHQNANETYMNDGVKLLELAQSAGRLFRKQTGAEKRRLLQFVVSNCTLAGGKITVELKQPFDMIAEAVSDLTSTPAGGVAKNVRHPDWLGN